MLLTFMTIHLFQFRFGDFSVEGRSWVFFPGDDDGGKCHKQIYPHGKVRM